LFLRHLQVIGHRHPPRGKPFRMPEFPYLPWPVFRRSGVAAFDRSLTLIDGLEVDVKFTQGRSWTIPREAIGKPCLLISADDRSAKFSLGFLIARSEYLRPARNQDKKRGTSAAAFGHTYWVFSDEPYPENFWLRVESSVIDKIVAGRTGNERVSALFRELLDRPIPRRIVEDVAGAKHKDPLRRVRSDDGVGTREVLAGEGILVISGNKKKHQRLVQTMGLPSISRDQFISHRVSRADRRKARAAGLVI
ncbi:MAG: NaeI family type II restriction endonuclease, partial [Acidobacteriota bacterium]|nr:NaeI family type II restriction endonuclease [Acidobacteriota bacterium]